MEALISIDEFNTYSRELDVFTGKPDVFTYGALDTDTYPPLPLHIPRQTEEEPPVLVWGWKLLSAAEQRGMDRIRIRRITCTPLERLKRALILEGRRDSYSAEEKHRFLDYLSGKGVVPEKWDEVSPLIASKGSFIPQARQYEKLTEQAKDLVNSGLLDLKTAEQGKHIPEAALAVLRPVLESGSFSVRRQLIEMISEVCIRDNCTPADAVRLAENLGARDEPLAYCMKLRYPRLTGLMEKFTQFRNNHLAGTGITLEPPKYFEGDTFQALFTFRSVEEFEKRIKSLEQLRKNIDGCLDLL
ncbi:MAG: hypothetical protein ACLFST_09595 [Spirochaetia bacterium]